MWESLGYVMYHYIIVIVILIFILILILIVIAIAIAIVIVIVIVITFTLSPSLFSPSHPLSPSQAKTQKIRTDITKLIAPRPSSSR